MQIWGPAELKHVRNYSFSGWPICHQHAFGQVSPSQHLMRWYLDVPGYASSKFLMMPFWPVLCSYLQVTIFQRYSGESFLLESISRLWTGNKMKIETGEKVKAGFDFDRFQSQLSVAVVVCPYFRVSRLPSEKSFVEPKCF